MRCAYHPKVETLLRCSKCEKPICSRCAILTPVGSRCRQCAGLRRLPTFDARPVDILRAVGAALVVGLAVGAVLGFTDALFPLFLRWLLRAAGLVGAGYLVGEAVSIATNRKRGGPFQIIAVLGFVASYAVFELLTPGILVGDLYTIVGFIIGLALAVGRVR